MTEKPAREALSVLMLEIRDGGFENGGEPQGTEGKEPRPRGSGLGIKAMRERASSVGAEFFMAVAPEGSVVRVSMAMGGHIRGTGPLGLKETRE